MEVAKGHNLQRKKVILVLAVFIQYPCVIHDMYHFLCQGIHFCTHSSAHVSCQYFVLDDDINVFQSHFYVLGFLQDFGCDFDI